MADKTPGIFERDHVGATWDQARDRFQDALRERIDLALRRLRQVEADLAEIALELETGP
jgi:hypothetical protein